MLFLCLLPFNLLAQTFTDQTGIILPGFSNGTTSWGDYDNDDDLDLLISGLFEDNLLKVKIFRNKGDNTFEDVGDVFTPDIPNVFNYYEYAIRPSWADFNNDGYLDILLDLSNNARQDLYIYGNAANGTFTQQFNLPYVKYSGGSSTDHGDYDNDGDEDILLTTSASSRILANQGGFVFKEQYSVSLDGLERSSSKWIDYDNDGDLDIFQSGREYYTSYIYKNSGNNIFQKLSGINIVDLSEGKGDWGDYDGDGFPDLLLTGNFKAMVYKNNGNNTFTYKSSIVLPGLKNGTGKWGDFDNDGDLDIILSGLTNAGNISKLYLNSGENSFAEATGTNLFNAGESSIGLGDYDKDGDLDLILAGLNGSVKTAKIYKNNSSVSNILPGTPSGLNSVISETDISISWGEVTNDNTAPKSLSYNIMVGSMPGGSDVVNPLSSAAGIRRIPMTGNAQYGTTYILRNLKKGTYYYKVQAIDNGLLGGPFSTEASFNYNISSQAFGLTVPSAGAKIATLTWSRGNGSKCIVFIKEGQTGNAIPVNSSTYIPSNVFKSGSEITGTGWYCIYSGSGTTVDVTGLSANKDFICQVLEYDGNAGAEIYNTQYSVLNSALFKTGYFTELTGLNLKAASTSSLSAIQTPTVTWLDLDNDNDLDLLISGPSASALYRNDLDDHFTLLPQTIASGYSVSCSDYNLDGFIDILVCASPWKLYKNNGNQTFTEQTGLPFASTSLGSGIWGDYDNDGDPDLLISGISSETGVRISKVYRNDQGNVFTEQSSIVIEGVQSPVSSWIDYDNDGYLDLFINGHSNSGGFITKFYHNNGNNVLTEMAGIPVQLAAGDSYKWCDIDFDGDQDLIILNYNVSKIYRNDRNNVFTELTDNSFPENVYGSIEHGDYDSDGDADLLITGLEHWIRPSTSIFRNNGNFQFEVDTLSCVTDISYGSTAWGDYDNDGDLDLAMTGVSPEGSVSKIFRNDLNVVNPVSAAPSGTAVNVLRSDAILRWNPVISDNTSYKTLTYNIQAGIISGGFNVVSPLSSSAGFRRISEPGNAGLDTSYTLKNLPFGTYYWRVQAIDNGFAGGPFSNEGSFNIVPVQAKNLTAEILQPTSLLLKWERGNGDRCIVFCKQSSSGAALPVNNSGYIGDGEFSFGEQIGTTGWFCVFNGRSDSVVVTGLLQNKQYIFHIFEYKGTFGSEQYFTEVSDGNPGVFSTSSFTEQTDISLFSYFDNTVDWGDYNNDGFIDILIPGFPSRIYSNSGNNEFIEKTGIPLISVRDGSGTWGDYDNDGDLDIIMTGASVNSNPSSSPVTKIYRNDGSDVFTEQAVNQITALYHSSSEWGDYDNDGDLDLLITGATGPDPDFKPVSKIFMNNGNNIFRENVSALLTGILKGSGKWIDLDNDGDLDIILSGTKGSYSDTGVTIMYKNNGKGEFSEQAQLDHSGASYADLSWGDFDNDGDADLIRTRSGHLGIYQNKGDFNFTKHYEIDLSSYSASICYASFADYNNDGYMDFILTNPRWSTRIYRNTHGVPEPGAVSDWFKIEENDALSSFGYSFANLADYDNDGDLDFILAMNDMPTKIFKNNLIMKSGRFAVNNPPGAPSDPCVTHNPNGVLLKWKPVRSDVTSYKTMTYNVKIGTSTENADICPPNASTSGFRKMAAMGNAQLDTTFLLKNLPSGKYFWQVQAVDQAYTGGVWSAIDSFEVKNVQTFFTFDEVCHGYSTHFTDQSVAIAGIVSWKWDFSDGTTATSRNPSHTYAQSGTFNVKLVITDAGGTKDSLVHAVIVRAKPLAAFNAPSVCTGTPVSVTNTTNSNGLTILGWSWNFGDASTSPARQPPPHPYLTPADYTISLKVVATNLCADSVTNVISVGNYPVAVVSISKGSLTFCKGDSVTLNVPSGTGYSYAWKTSGTNLTGAIQNTFNAKNSGNYTAEIINPKGNCISTSPVVNVVALNSPAAPFISADRSLLFCQGDSSILSVTNTSGNSYNWKLNGGAIGADKNLFAAKASGEYSLVVSNSSGCSVSSVNKITVTVNPKPNLPVISTSGITTFCQGNSVDLSVPSLVGHSYTWRNQNGVIPGNTANSLTASASGAYQVDISNSYGCAVTTLPVNVTVKPSPNKPVLDKTNYSSGQCPGENPVRLSVNPPVPGYRYTWYKNGLPQQHDTLSYLEFFESGNYKLAAELNGCTTESDLFTAEFPEGLPKPFIYAQGPTFWYLACSNTEASKYRWYFNGKPIEGADKYFYLANYKLGSYHVNIANKDGCYTRSDIITIPPGYTGIEDDDPFNTLVVYPNPTTGLLTLAMNNNIMGEMMIRVITQDGKEILNFKAEKTSSPFEKQIDLSGQSKGTYLIFIYLNKTSVVRKIIIE